MTTYYGPELNDGKHVFVFGSNLAGRHGKGAALTAKNYWGARDGWNCGPQGQAFAIPTKNANMKVMPLSEIKCYVDWFLKYASAHGDLTFLVTAIGCGLAHYDHKDIAPMFAWVPSNVVLPHEWKEILDDIAL